MNDVKFLYECSSQNLEVGSRGRSDFVRKISEEVILNHIVVIKYNFLLCINPYRNITPHMRTVFRRQESLK